MKATTHNILMCNTKKCSKTDNNYPFIVKPTNIGDKEVDFDLERIKILYDKQDKRGLNEFCKGINMYKFDFTSLDEETKTKNDFWEYVHKILNETIINDGVLVCPNCGREYSIKNGIINMVLEDNEM